MPSIKFGFNAPIKCDFYFPLQPSAHALWLRIGDADLVRCDGCGTLFTRLSVITLRLQDENWGLGMLWLDMEIILSSVDTQTDIFKSRQQIFR